MLLVHTSCVQVNDLRFTREDFALLFVLSLVFVLVCAWLGWVGEWVGRTVGYGRFGDGRVGRGPPPIVHRRRTGPAGRPGGRPGPAHES